jgi:hypothetical protein
MISTVDDMPRALYLKVCLKPHSCMVISVSLNSQPRLSRQYLVHFFQPLSGGSSLMSTTVCEQCRGSGGVAQHMISHQNRVSESCTNTDTQGAQRDVALNAGVAEMGVHSAAVGRLEAQVRRPHANETLCNMQLERLTGVTRTLTGVCPP